MAEERGVLRRIVWRDVFPGIMLFRCFRLGISLQLLTLATIGTLLMPIGPWISRSVFSWKSNLPVVLPAAEVSRADEPSAIWKTAATTVANSVSPSALLNPRTGLQERFYRLVAPFVQLFERQASLGQLCGNLAVALWYLLVWSFFGGAITRIAVVRLGCGEQVTLRQAVRHALANLGWYFASPLFPLLGVALAVVPLFVLGLLMRLSAGILVAGILWPLALLVGLAMAALLVGLLFGWLLMWPTISAEEASDSFQAFSNSFSFTFQRPLQYLAYALIAVLLGSLGGLLVESFADAILSLTHWAISFGLGRDRLNQIVEGQWDHYSLVWVGTGLMDLGDRFVHAIADGYYFSFLFCTASAIYLLLRREVDQTDFDEVYLPDDDEQFSLPPLRTGPHGVPEVEETPTTTTPLM